MERSATRESCSLFQVSWVIFLPACAGQYKDLPQHVVSSSPTVTFFTHDHTILASLFSTVSLLYTLLQWCCFKTRAQALVFLQHYCCLLVQNAAINNNYLYLCIFLSFKGIVLHFGNTFFFLLRDEERWSFKQLRLLRNAYSQSDSFYMGRGLFFCPK